VVGVLLRGHYELYITKDNVKAQYFGMPTIINRNPGEISLANFTVLNGANALLRVGGTTAFGGEVENGYARGAPTVQTNITNSTDTGKYFISMDNEEDL
jgi:alkaline phosphatase D